jgi:hypothetical protein
MDVCIWEAKDEDEMSVTGTKGRFGWGRQAAAGTAATIAHWHKAHTVNFGEVEGRVALDPEVGGSILVPQGLLKTGVHAAGGVEMTPRLEDEIGWLFLAMMGSCATTADSPVATVNHHEFTFQSEEDVLEWLTLAKWQPGTAAAQDTGERITDAKIALGRFVLPVRDRLRIQWAMLGIKPEAIVNPASNASWVASFEGVDSIPITAKPSGSVKFDPLGSPVTIFPYGMTVDFTNGLTDPATQESVIGSYYPVDIGVLTRAAIIRFTLRVSNYNWWAQTVFNQATAAAMSSWTEWSPVVYSTSFEVEVQSAAVITGTTPYSLKIAADNVAWTVDPVALIGGQMAVLNFTGVVIEPTTGDAFRLELENEVASYSW